MLLRLLIIATVATSQVAQAEQFWHDFATTWMLNLLDNDAFAYQPRTVQEAQDAGFVLVSNDCSEGAEFMGTRYAPPEADKEFIVIYDVNGFIAGMHSVVPKSVTFDDLYFKFSTSKWYRSDNLNGMDVYLTTAYFVDPAIICTSGRTQEQFDTEGTGNVLLFQNGPTASDVVTAPLTETEAVNDPFWFKQYCFLNMGNHFFNHSYNADEPCDDAVPIQLVYHNEDLNGFVWQHIAPINGKRWETVTETAINAIVNTPPKCLADLTVTPGVRTMHTYVREHLTFDFCIFDKDI